MVLVLDDVGVDMLGAFDVHPSFPPTPNIDALIADGVLFERCYTPPSCSPTRAAVLTGRHSFRTGIGQPINELLPEPALLLSERTLPEVLAAGSARPVASSAIGKWHLGSESAGGADHPNLQGFEWFEGPLGNLFNNQTYFNYAKIRNGVRYTSDVYATTDQVNDALGRIAAMPEPWLLWVGFSAAHTPLHAPPAHLHTYSLAGDPAATPYEHYCAMVQALDTELGRLLAGIDPAVRARTTVILLGDNGSPQQVVIPPSIPSQSKGSLFEGGVRVPLVISGHQVAARGQRCLSLVQTVDLFPTIVGLFGADLEQGVGDGRPIDGRDLAPYLADVAATQLRSYVAVDKFEPNGFGPYTEKGAMIRDERWKLIRRSGQPDALFDLEGRDREGPDLNTGTLDGEQQKALARLRHWLDSTVP
jgi:arylsulfatase A-like enzyme